MTKRLLLLLYFIHLTGFLNGASSQMLIDWRFQRGDPQGAEKKEFKDTAWEDVRLPHDWSILGLPAQEEASDYGGGFFPTGIGWYRTDLLPREAWRGQQVSLLFEGAYRRTEVWVNGQRIAENENGYLPFRADLSDKLIFGERNTIAVRVDNERQPNSRWYSGSGLYRPVHLEIRDPIHVEPDSLFVHTAYLYPQTATLEVNLTVSNELPKAAEGSLDLHIIDPDGFPITSETLLVDLKAQGKTALKVNISVGNPRLWAPESPELYRCVARVFVGGRLTDRIETSFGIHTIEFSADEGFLLNGQPYLLAGGNVHHDNGPLGACAFPDAEKRKVELLKKAGFNALRTAHNPPSTAFLRACDEAGVFVIAEAFDGWKSAKLKGDYSVEFDARWQADLTTFIRRDRNHPSIIMWSIGNEMYERGKDSAPATAAEMGNLIRELDPSRATTVGLNGLGETAPWQKLDPLFEAVDVAGYNYELINHQEADRKRVPNRILYASESFHHEVADNWSLIRNNSAIIGEFLWSAMDYLGEAGIGRVFEPGEAVLAHWEGNHFPLHGASCGILDIIGQPKAHLNYRRLILGKGPGLSLAVVPPTSAEGNWQPSKWAVPPLESSWTWPGQEGRPMTVEVYTRHPLVRLFVDKTLVGEKALNPDDKGKLTFIVPYAPGTLKAQGIDGESVVEESFIETSGPPKRIRLKADRQSIRPNNMDLVFVDVSLTDALGRTSPNTDIALSYAIEGPGEIIAIGSSDLASQQSYQANPRLSHKGRALVIIRAKDEPGAIFLRASAANLVEGAVGIRSTYQP